VAGRGGKHPVPSSEAIVFMTRKNPPKRKAQSSVPALWLILCGMLSLGVIAYWNSFGVPFVFDDLLTVQRNAAVRFGAVDWNPLAGGRALLFATLTLNYLWTAQTVWSYHLVNLVFHLINGVLVFFIAEHIFEKVKPDARRNRIFAFLAAGVFVLHPLQTESVTYISSRSELLSLIFYLAAFLLFIKWPEAKIGFFLSLLIGLLFVLGISSKETVISLPATVFLYDFLFLSRASFRPMLQRWRFYGVFLAGGIGVAYYVATNILQGSIGATPKGHLSYFSYFLTELRVIVRYIYLIFLPIGQTLDYDFRPSSSPFELKVIASFLFLSATVFLAWRIRKTQPVIAFSVFWLFLTLAPTSSFVPILDVIFEHRMYLPLAGFCVCAPLLLELTARKLTDWFDVPLGPTPYFVIVLGSLLVATHLRNETWGTEVGLYEDVLAKAPYKDRAYTGLSWALFKKGDYERAIQTMKQGLVALPDRRKDFADTLGNLYLKTGRYNEAVDVFKEAIRLNKDPKWIAVEENNLGVSYMYMWDALKKRVNEMPDAQFKQEAAKLLFPSRDAFFKAVQLDPDMTYAFDSYVNVSYDMGAADALESSALVDLEKKESFNSLYAVGKIAFQRAVSGINPAANWARAAEYFSKAEKLKPEIKLLYFNHAYALRQLNRKDEAMETYLKAIRVDPIFIEAHHNVAMIYMERKQYQEAISHLQEVLRYDPNHKSANETLAKLFVAIEDKETARKHLRTILAYSPNDPEVLDLWKKLGL
jgi:tetratricopeptide (TPR) repeat protein